MPNIYALLFSPSKNLLTLVLQLHQELYFTHYDHCVDMLYQNIICTGNTDIITMQWMDTQHHPFPDFSINHQCRDFDSLIQWRKDNSVVCNLFLNQTLTLSPSPSP